MGVFNRQLRLGGGDLIGVVSLVDLDGGQRVSTGVRSTSAVGEGHGTIS